MEMASKNIAIGEPITDVRDIKRLALERKPVVWIAGWRPTVRPAAFFLGWPLRLILDCKFYYAIKIEK